MVLFYLISKTEGILFQVEALTNKQISITREKLYSKIAKDKDLFVIEETEKYKTLRSLEFNYNFDKRTGYYEQYGKNVDDDPSRCEFGPIIADIEVLDMCKGSGASQGLDNLCPFCYKSNTKKGTYMTIEEYKKVFSKLPKTLTQIAFGADSDLSLNPDIFKIMEYTREQGVIPNITVADLTEETSKKLSQVAGAVAVSWYGVHSDKNLCYDTIEKLTRLGMKQVNIHFMLSKATETYVDELIQDIKTDSRLEKLNAVVFLSLKTKGRGAKYVKLEQEKYNEVVAKLLKNNIPFGFDSCSQVKFANAVKGHPMEKEFLESSEPCESMKTSIYISDKGKVYPCSFMEDMNWNSLDYFEEKPHWDLFSDTYENERDFVNKIWNSHKSIQFGCQSTICNSCNQGCQLYDV